MTEFDKRNQPKFTDLISLEDWQKIQDTFARITNVGLRTLDAEGKLILQPSNLPRLCKDMLKGTPYSIESCGASMPTFLGGKAVVDHNLSFTYPPGFHNFLAPLRVDHSRVLAYMVLGPVVLVMRKPKETYQDLADELEVDLDVLWQEIQKIRVISFHRVMSLVEMIKEVGEYILKLAYDNLTMGSKVVSQMQVKFQSLLPVLLDVAIQVSGADMGSIMLLDKDHKQLTIRAAKNLPEQVVKNTRVEIGNGLCGTSVQEGRPILVDDDQKDNRIRKYMHRPYLKSSMVVPIKAQDDVFGCLNLGALEVSPLTFSQQHIADMQSLIDLATEALYTPIKQHVGSKSEYFAQLL